MSARRFGVAALLAGWAAFVALAGAVPAHATAQDAGPKPIELVVDTSGSMGDDDAGGQLKKIDGAKAALLDFVAAVQQKTPVGLRTYPREDGGCDTGVNRQPIAPINATTLSAAIRSLRPLGDTPTAETLEVAAAELRKAGGGTLVLVSDGLHTCQDPCPVAKQLAGRDVDFQTITVGFRIDEQGRKELQCIADAFGGQYVDARDGADLATAVTDAGRSRLEVHLAATHLEAVADSPVQITASVKNSGHVAATDVVAQIGPTDETENPGILRPVQRLGNLEPGASRDVTWTFTPSSSVLRGASSSQDVGLRITASADNIDKPQRQDVNVLVSDLTAAKSAGPMLKGRNLAILGDSYSAGEGADNYFPSTRTSSNRCHRSALTYLMPALGLADDRLLACSGAVINDIFEANKSNGVAAQRDQLSDLQNRSNVDGVVMTLAGNDVGFKDLAQDCITAKLPCSVKVDGEDSERFLQERVGNDQLRDRLVDAFGRVNSTLNNTTVYRRRRSIAPILVPAYPYVVPLTGRSCLPMFDLLLPSEIDYVTRFESLLNDQIEAATLEARRQGIPVFFVPTTQTAFMPDHSLCDGDPYARALNSFNGVDPRDSPSEALDKSGEQHLDDLLEKGHETTQSSSRFESVKGGFIEELATLAKAFVAGGLQEMVHPNANGYAAETRAILRWSVTPEARDDAASLATYKPVKLLPSWPLGSVDLGQLAPEGNPQLQGGTAYPVSQTQLAPGTALTVTIHSSAQILGAPVADAQGDVRAQIEIPRTLLPGHHTLQITGTQRDGQPFERLAVVTVHQPFRWTTNWTWMVALAAMVFVCLASTLTAGFFTRQERLGRR